MALTVGIHQLIILLIPISLAGIINMVWVNTPYCSQWATPMDRGRYWTDNKRIFGDNKTWKGFWGMAVFTAITVLIYELCLSHSTWLQSVNLLQFKTPFHTAEAFAVGFLLGLAYVVFELPNSFIKRRINIEAGKNASGKKGIIFTVVDQADSVIGCALISPFFTPLKAVDVIFIIITGTTLHLLINAGLFVMGLKKQPR